MVELPKRFEQKMKDKLGNEFPAFEAAIEEKPPVSIRINPSKAPELFANEEQVPWCRYGHYLKERPAFVWDPLYHAGAYYAQEAFSMLFANAIDFSKDLKVLDLCAAPGGKSSLLLSFLSTDSLLVSNEMVGKRASILYENLVKWGCANNVVTQNRASDFLPFAGYFDVVLVDAPCSGEGMFRKDRGAVEQWSEGLVEQCSVVQKDILQVAVELVAPGGLLIYSTCTFEAEENENNLKWLYQHYADSLSPAEMNIKPEWGLKEVEVTTDKGQVQRGYYCFPHRVKGEGLFISAMRVDHSRAHRTAKGQKLLRKLNAGEAKMLGSFAGIKKGIGAYTHDAKIYLLPEKLEEDFSAFLQKLYTKKAGINAGTVNRDTLIPDHELAMSGMASENIPRVPLSLEQSLDYMQRKPVTVDAGVPKGWIIFTYEGLDIGWAKNLGNRVNMHYPTEWRIRKEPDFY